MTTITDRITPFHTSHLGDDFGAAALHCGQHCGQVRWVEV